MSNDKINQDDELIKKAYKLLEEKLRNREIDIIEYNKLLWELSSNKEQFLKEIEQ